MIRQFGGSSGVALQPQGLDLGLGGSILKSPIQRGTSTLNAVTYLDVNVSSVDPLKSIVIITSRGGWQYTDTVSVEATVINSTTIRLQVTSVTYNLLVSWELIEFQNVKSIQSGTITSPAGNPATATIAEVNPLKTIVIGSHRTTYAGLEPVKNATYLLELTNSTTITYTPYVQGVCGWFAVELN